MANNSIQAFNEENIYENEDNDYHHVFQNHIIDENAIDEINLLNNNFNKGYYHNNHNPYNHLYNYFGHHNHQGNHSAGFKTLPPIENSLTSKVIWHFLSRFLALLVFCCVISSLAIHMAFKCLLNALFHWHFYFL